VARKQDAELQSALDRLIEAGLLFRQGVPPHATYLFKHALVQDAAYGTLLREPRCALHARIAETVEGQFSHIAESEPELLARHCTEAGLIEKAALLWGKAGQRSVERSALVEAEAQLTRALDQITTLPSTPALRRDQIKLQVALITPLMYVKGYAAPETKAAAEQALLLIEQTKAMGEALEDSLLLFSALYGLWVTNLVAFNGDVIRELAAQFLALAEKQGTTVPLMIGHRLMASSLMLTGDIAQGRAHYDQAIALYDPVEHRPLATRFGQDVGVAILSFRSLSLWLLGYPEAALADLAEGLKDAREIGQAATLMYALIHTTMFVHIPCGSYTSAKPALEEVIALADEKHAPFVKALAMLDQAWILTLTGKASDAIQMFTIGMAAHRSTGATIYEPMNLSHLAKAEAELGHFDDAWRYMDEAMAAIEATKERWFEAEANRIAGQIALLSPEPNAAKAQGYFERALQIARQQQAKSWELRAAISMARLWRDQGKRTEARDFLAPVYGWFTQGFDTRDLKEAKALLQQLAS
jgi:predicted ATPase